MYAKYGFDSYWYSSLNISYTLIESAADSKHHLHTISADMPYLISFNTLIYPFMNYTVSLNFYDNNMQYLCKLGSAFILHT